MVVTVTLAQSTILLSDARKTPRLATSVHRVDNPIDPRVPTDRLVVRIHQDHLVILVHTILIHPVRVQHPQITASFSYSLFGGAPEASLELEVVDTLTDGFTIGGTLGNVFLAVSTAHSDTVDDVPLLGLVTETAGLVRTRWSGCAMNDVQLAIFPASHAKQETEDIRLLFFIQFTNVLVRAHLAAVA